MGIGLRPLCPIDIIFRISRSLLCPHLTELTLWGAKVWRNANDSAASYFLPGHNITYTVSSGTLGPYSDPQDPLTGFKGAASRQGREMD